MTVDELITKLKTFPSKWKVQVGAISVDGMDTERTYEQEDIRNVQCVDEGEILIEIEGHYER